MLELSVRLEGCLTAQRESSRQLSLEDLHLLSSLYHLFDVEGVGKPSASGQLQELPEPGELWTSSVLRSLLPWWNV